MVENIVGLVAIAFVFFALLLVFILMKEIEKQRHQSRFKQIRVYSPESVTSKSVQKSLEKIISKSQKPFSAQPVQLVKKVTMQRLLSLVNGDMETAKRLVIQAREKNPVRDEQWCWEKVIYDLERDRRV
jgi:hypothetical protein